MKRLLILLFVAATAICMYAAELNSQQKKLRSEILSFLREEGYAPELDDDGDIAFKREGDKWYVLISASDENPMFVTLRKGYMYEDEYNYESISAILHELNDWKGVKTRLGKTAFSLVAELYVVSAEPFKHSFYKLAKQIDNMEEDLIELIKKTQSR